MKDLHAEIFALLEPGYAEAFVLRAGGAEALPEILRRFSRNGQSVQVVEALAEVAVFLNGRNCPNLARQLLTMLSVLSSPAPDEDALTSAEAPAVAPEALAAAQVAPVDAEKIWS